MIIFLHCRSFGKNRSFYQKVGTFGSNLCSFRKNLPVVLTFRG